MHMVLSTSEFLNDQRIDAKSVPNVIYAYTVIVDKGSSHFENDTARRGKHPQNGYTDHHLWHHWWFCSLPLCITLSERWPGESRGREDQAGVDQAYCNPVKGCLLGAFTATVLQSSSLTMIVLIGLINAGILTLKQGIGVMLGSEIGTTVV